MTESHVEELYTPLVRDIHAAIRYAKGELKRPINRFRPEDYQGDFCIIPGLEPGYVMDVLEAIAGREMKIFEYNEGGPKTTLGRGKIVLGDGHINFTGAGGLDDIDSIISSTQPVDPYDPRIRDFPESPCHVPRYYQIIFWHEPE
jgi:hypothetical protein